MAGVIELEVSPVTAEELTQFWVDEPEVAARVKFSNGGTLPQLPKHCYALDYKGYRLIFSFWKKEGVVYEGHVLCPKASTIASRALILLAINWVFEVGAPDAAAILTRCPEGKIANTARKLGFLETKVEGSDSFFSIPRPSKRI